jgi:predicted nucleotidyltransferase
MRGRIIETLREIEREWGVTILYACEAGSRAWGFHSPDSDWDIRFIYAHDRDYYLSFNVESRRDVIELPIVDDIDCNGWDIRKALYLFTRTNGALLEWLGSPIVYTDGLGIRDKLLKLANRAANKRALCYHYSHMAKGNAREYLQGDTVRLKKYLYVIRPIMAIKYIQRYDEVPPVEFRRLIDVVATPELTEGLNKLLEMKARTPEMGNGPAIPVLSDYIKTELLETTEDFSGQGRPKQNEMGEIVDELNDLFRLAINPSPER